MLAFFNRLPPRCIPRTLAWTILVGAGCKTVTVDDVALDRYHRFVEAHRSRDVERMMSLYDDDARIVFSSDHVLGPPGVRTIYEFDFAVRVRCDYRLLETTPTTVRIGLVERNDFLERVGIEAIDIELELAFEDERVVRHELVAMSFRGATLEAAMEPVLAWAREHRSEALAPLMNPGPVYDGTTAALWLALLDDWRASNDP